MSPLAQLTDRLRRHRSGFRALHVLLLSPAVLYAFSTLPAAQGFQTRLGQDGLDLLENGGYVAALLLCLLRTDPASPNRLSSRLLTGALGGYALGNLTWTSWIRDAPDAPSPNVSDLAYFAFYPLAFASLFVASRHRDSRHARSLWLDGFVGGLATAALATAVLLGPTVDLVPGSLSAVATALSYPLLDLLLGVVLAGTLALHGWRPPFGVWLLGAGLLVMLVTDASFVVVTAQDTFSGGGVIDGGWVVSCALIALTPGWPSTPTGPRLPAWALLAIPLVASAAALSVLLVDHVHRLNPVAVGLAAATIVLALARLIVTFREVTTLAENRELALTDDLTGLDNRRALYRSAPALIGAEDACTQIGLLLLDLDRFKEVNDSLGHHAGDVLLRGVGLRLRQAAPQARTTARLGGDEFAVLLVDTDPAEAAAVAARIHEVLAEPLDVEGVSVRVRASIGVALLPAGQAGLSTLLRQADVAMYHAKTGRLGTFAYSLDVDEFASGDRLTTAELLRTDIEARRMVVHYQPKVDAVTGSVDSVEALVRWVHPQRGLLAPDAFLPVVEAAGLMDDLTTAVFEQAVDQARTWLDAGTPLAVAVNLSASSLRDRELPDRLQALLAGRGVPPRLVEVEITEDFLMADTARARAILGALRAKGLRVAVDDYGTGYSSLAYLRELPLDDLKLDKSFLTDLVTDARARAIVRSTISLAHSLGLRLVAEGVEDEETAAELTAAGCDVLQGWHYARAMPAAELDEWLGRRAAAVPV